MQSVNSQAITPPHNKFTPALDNTLNTQAKSAQRQEWIDCLRGITMLLVVITHCETYLIGAHSDLSNICLVFRMPLFFFISGFFAYSSKVNHQSLSNITQPIKRRIKGVLLPTFTVATCFFLFLNLFSGYTLSEMLLDSQKGGYWFTLVSIEVFFLCIPLICLLNSSLPHAVKAITILVFMAASAIMRDYSIIKFTGRTLFQLFSVEYILEYFPYFCLGILTKAYYNTLKSYIDKTYVLIAIILLFIAAIQIAPFLRFKVCDCRLFPVISLFLLGVFFIFSRLKRFLNTRTKVGKTLSTIGQNTLQIYLFHYFILILFATETIQTIFTWKTLNLNLIIPVTITVAFIIVFLCLQFDRLLSKLKIRWLIFPKYK